jgi:N-acetylmuramic acid 6-phosphate etherase
MLTTTAMIKMGKVYENMMIDLQPTNKKLTERSKKIVMIITGVSYNDAEKFLKESGGHVKTTLVMIKAGVSAAEAKARLKKTDGFVRKAIGLK